jgi:hypothetical protein
MPLGDPRPDLAHDLLDVNVIAPALLAPARLVRRRLRSTGLVAPPVLATPPAVKMRAPAVW